MGDNIDLIIFDWGRTLHDVDSGVIFDGVPELISELSQKYTLAIVSLAKIESPEIRRQSIEASGISKYFKMIMVGGEDKNKMYEHVLEELNVIPKNVIVVDDRAFRGIAWGNSKGATTIWLRKGKFKDELPNQSTGEPTHIIYDIKEIMDVISFK